jgi:translation initiation factor 1 (eIF-1/SUI1)
LARLSELSGKLPSLPAESVVKGGASSDVDPATPLARALASRIVISRDARGRGGKTVTFARGIAGTPELLEALARELRHELGTGVRALDGELVVQGALTDRLAKALAKRGAARIVIGN